MPSRTLRRKRPPDVTPAPIAILTDFGYRDHYVGVMKGVIATIAPETRVIDISHGIPPQSVIAGAMALKQSWRFFPKYTVFLVVVDPGVGSARKAVAIETRAGSLFVGPDNGVMSLAANEAGLVRIVELREPKYQLKDVSSTFHGRDIFAPAAASLSNGTRLSSLGPAIKEITHLSLPTAARRDRTIAGEVIYIDGFGNLVTNITRAMLDNLAASFRALRLLVRIDKGATMEIFQAYADAPIGAPLALPGSFELLEIAIRNGNAASFFGLGEGAPVTVIAST
jgi:S-adenosyl-L-methionine hydrolase (adenosine-forming)